MKIFETNYENWDDVGHSLSDIPCTLSLLNNIAMINKNFGVDILNVCSKGQLLSKAWLFEEFPNEMLSKSPKIYICAGWYGMAAAILRYKLIGNYKIKSIDQDPKCLEIGNALNAEDFKLGRFTTVEGDIMDFSMDDADLVINTSCEHIHDLPLWSEKIPRDSIVVLQSNNNYSIEEHVNCVNSPEELLLQCPLGYVHYKGTIKLPDYERYMIIGIK